MDEIIKKLTKAQKKALWYASNDGSLIIGGLDGRKVRLDVAFNLVDKGLLLITNTPAGYDYYYEFILTDNGIKICERIQENV
jgi:hypothetical protein